MLKVKNRINFCCCLKKFFTSREKNSPAEMMTTEQKSPISASDRRKRLIRWASSKTLSIRNLAFPAGIADIVSRRITSPFKHTKL